MLINVSTWSAQLHTQTGGSACGASGHLVLTSDALRNIFVASTAELPGLLLAALVMDKFGRKWCATTLPPRKSPQAATSSRSNT